jgi:hypothetical protein
VEFYPTFRLESVDPSLGVQHAFHGSPEYNAPVQPPRRQGLHFEKYTNSLPAALLLESQPPPPPSPSPSPHLTLTLPGTSRSACLPSCR